MEMKEVELEITAKAIACDRHACLSCPFAEEINSHLVEDLYSIVTPEKIIIRRRSLIFFNSDPDVYYTRCPKEIEMWIHVYDLTPHLAHAGKFKLSLPVSILRKQDEETRNNA